ncbi:DUF4956 domain-containing protein [candidate division KSB1 bacterium]|nr:DUF4956 domain-containing protein [candidate division KSB1 bacterium]NIR70391.1 DUF4956 domain-containing protein [candidate division KSB1 bacterium]NIS23070.1 DUF4956 domain-containing protein [candidate division KSB1 bacterium]NIT71444.1 DUF4956 domain-containing protein [candidate division KSB1 bacterium]NIU25118.1 DUF4956 domain-containing protein [candidate division KSB1 bacterium]
MNFSNVLNVDLTPAQVVLSFLLAFSLGFVWATVYRKTHSGVAYTRSFFLSLLLIPSIVAMVMMAIGSNVALSLGLVGSLSVIRFRTVIKDAKDMTFLFLAIGIGLCCGANAWLVAIIGTSTISVVTVVMSKIGHNAAGSADYILIFRSDQKEPWNSIKPEAQSLISWKQLRGATDIDHGKDFEYTYSVKLASKASPEKIVSELSNGVVREVTLITPENHLEL